MDVFPKFVIEGDSLIIAKVKYHKEIVTDRDQVRGGGWFRWIREVGKTDILVFYGKSEDFGPAKLADIRECVKNGKVFTYLKGRNISYGSKFAYDTGTEIIPLPVEKIPEPE